MTPGEVSDALAWTGGTGLIDGLDAAFADRTEAALAVRIDAQTRAAIAGLGERSRRRILRAPEVTRRLLFASTDRGEADGFLTRAVAVEKALAGDALPPPEPCWSALGDIMLRPDQTHSAWPQLDACAVALDFGSPWAQSIDLCGLLERTDAPRKQLTRQQAVAIKDRLDETARALAALSPTIHRFVERATCVLVLQIDPEHPEQVASGTNGKFIGRSFVANPHLPAASVEFLAEAIVHESIHGLLYRDSLTRPWLRGDAAVEAPRIRSPWTARMLPVRAFLEAACVWFGLSHLWALAHWQGGLDRGVARERLIRSVSGFGQGSLADLIRPWRDDIRPDVVEMVDALQRRLVVALDAA